MPDLIQQIQTEAARLLEEEQVELFIGFKAEDSPLHPQPAFITEASQAEQLTYNGLCQNNLVTFLPKFSRSMKIGMLVRGCEARAVNILAAENQHPRENLVLLGIPCKGIVDWRKLVHIYDEDISSVLETETELTLTVKGTEHRMLRSDALHDSCLRCIYPTPKDADVLLGDPLPDGDISHVWQQAQSHQNQAMDMRNMWFANEAERCIRCYACREACPMCYCSECFVDHITPRWTESTTTPAGQHAWHLIRAFHQTGRCTDCGACERACPMDIKMTYLTDKLNQDVYDQYGFEAGMSPTAQPPFATFSLDDRQKFVR
ncbi:MAG: 4Fe-4S dicluster domain-containing protein [Anaerolineaceae bacterium]|jgi:formate dehydrogenase subunit beta